MEKEPGLVVAANNEPSESDFKHLMEDMNARLNEDASRRPAYYKKRNGTALEVDVCECLTKCAIGTPFEGSITHVGGHAFPDIKANNYYGVEVKSSKDKHWKSTGSSILESTRIEDIKRIYMTFGKLSDPVGFKSRPYECCLSDIRVTHYPRYIINMDLADGDTIFDKMNISYEVLRRSEEPSAEVANYYKALLKPGEKLWWAPEQDISSPIRLRLWSNLSKEEKDSFSGQGYAYFPEIFSNNGQIKYNRLTMWLYTEIGIICPNVRDLFSASGQKELETHSGILVSMPAVYKHLERLRGYIIDSILTAEPDFLKEQWGLDVVKDGELRIVQWAKTASEQAANIVEPSLAYDVITKALGM